MQSLILDVNAYTADARSRRHVLNARTCATGNGQRQRAFTLPPSMAVPEDMLLDNTNAVVLHTPSEVQAIITVGGQSVTLAVTGVTVLPAHIDALKLRNVGTSSVDCVLIEQHN